MTAARKALEALEAARPVERVEFSVVADSLADSWHARGPAHDVEGDDDVSAYEAASADAGRFSAAVNLSAPLAAVVRAAMEYREAHTASSAQIAIHPFSDYVGRALDARSALFAALDAFNAAALAQGFAAGSGK